MAEGAFRPHFLLPYSPKLRHPMLLVEIALDTKGASFGEDHFHKPRRIDLKMGHLADVPGTSRSIIRDGEVALSPRPGSQSCRGQRHDPPRPLRPSTRQAHDLRLVRPVASDASTVRRWGQSRLYQPHGRLDGVTPGYLPHLQRRPRRPQSRDVPKEQGNLQAAVRPVREVE
jgi:hypothetical protein